MALQLARRALFRGADVLPWVLGMTAFTLGLQGRPSLLFAGGGLLVVAGALLLARTFGYVVPGPGRARVWSHGCRDVPRSFFVRHRGRGLLFYRDFGPGPGELPDVYTVVSVPDDCDGDTLRLSGFVPPEDSRFLGTVAVADFRFEHPGGEVVDVGSLAAALGKLEGPRR